MGASAVPPPEPESAVPAPSERPRKRKGRGLGVGGVVLALLRRPVVSVFGILLCSVVALLSAVLGPSGDALFNLASYIPFLGGGWAVYAASSPEGSYGQLPGRKATLCYVATALVVVVLSGMADVTLTILGGMVVRTALALGPTVALAQRVWPHQALWRGLLVIDEHPKAFVKVAAVSLGVAVIFVFLFGLLTKEAFGQAASGRIADGSARALGSVLISALWMRFYLGVRPGGDRTTRS